MSEVSFLCRPLDHCLYFEIEKINKDYPTTDFVPRHSFDFGLSYMYHIYTTCEER